MLLKSYIFIWLDHVLNTPVKFGLHEHQEYLKDIIKAVQRRATKLMIKNN